jgi:hypothetical protein
MCEIARNSVLQSGWEMKIKKRWLGEHVHFSGPHGNDIHKSNVPNIRLAHRYNTLMEERLMVLSSLRAMHNQAEADANQIIETEASIGSPKRMHLPVEPMLEHVIRSSPNFMMGSPSLNSFPNDKDIPTLKLSGSLGDKPPITSFPGVSILAERLGRDRYNSVLDAGFDEADADDMWD